MKKLFTLILALTILLSLSVPAFAAMEGTLEGGQIGVANPTEGQTYSAYQILYIESYDAENGFYSYKANSQWLDWLRTQTAYVAVDSQGYVNWVSQDEDAAAEFAKLASQQLSGKTPAGSTVAALDPDSGNVIAAIYDLKLGYYLVDTTVGSICSLTTTDPIAAVKDKHAEPTLDKEVHGCYDPADYYSKETTALLGGDYENYRITLTIKPGAQNYVVHDVMDPGVSMSADSLTVKARPAGSAQEPQALSLTTDYDFVNEGLTDTCDFEIRFKADYLDAVAQDIEVIIEYSACLNKNLTTGSAAPNKNTAWLTYGGDPSTPISTPPVTTNVYSYSIDIVKTDDKNNILDGAEFFIYNAPVRPADDDFCYTMVKISDGVYRFADNEELAGNPESDPLIPYNGKMTILGFPNADEPFYLIEAKAPQGYNRLTEGLLLRVSESDPDDMTATLSPDGNTYISGGVQVVNVGGSILPSTGGIGTTIFYVLGAVLMLGALVLLVTKRRMSKDGKGSEE